jgi:hypothetical protein
VPSAVVCKASAALVVSDSVWGGCTWLEARLLVPVILFGANVV